MALCSVFLAASASLNTSSTQRNHHVCFPYPFWHHIPESVSWRKGEAILGLTSFVSLLLGICAMCYLLSMSDSCCFIYFVQFSSCLQQKGKFVPRNFTKTGAQCYQFSRNPSQYIQHSNILHMDSLQSSQRKKMCWR